MRSEITSRENPLVKRVAAMLKSPADRRREGSFVCEGAVVLKEAVEAGAEIERVFFTDEKLIDNIDLPDKCDKYLVSRPVMEKLSGVTTPQGVVFTCPLPKNGELRGGRILALENISDPGNMGTIIRAAEAFSIDTLVLTGSCTDPFAPKVVRSTMGAVLRVNICRLPLDDFINGAKALGLQIYAAALTDNALPIGQVILDKCAVMIGSEASGLTKEALDKCDKNVIIPISGIQSLNAAVAASIFMYEMSKAR